MHVESDIPGVAGWITATHLQYGVHPTSCDKGVEKSGSIEEKGLKNGLAKTTISYEVKCTK